MEGHVLAPEAACLWMALLAALDETRCHATASVSDQAKRIERRGGVGNPLPLEDPRPSQLFLRLLLLGLACKPLFPQSIVL